MTNQAVKRRVGGIFLQLFVGLWIALIAIAASVWLISSNYQDYPSRVNSIDNGRNANRALNTALNVLHAGGREAFETWLKDSKRNSRPEIFVVDAQGNELTGRKVPSKALQELNAPIPNRLLVVHIMTQQGAWRMFAVRTQPLPATFFSSLMRTPLWVQFMMALLATTLVAGALAWHFARPIRKLDWAMRKAAEGNLDIRVATTVGHRFDEIGALAQRYDAMAEKIDGLLARQKRLFHDVSHELRSPLARLEMAIGIAQRDETRRDDMLERIEKEIQTLDALVEELLTYARLDDNAPMTFEPIDLVEVLSDIVDNANFEGEKRRVRILLETPDSCVLNIHVDTLGRAVENLIRNALRFSPDDGVVRVTLTIDGNLVRLEVLDQGPGIAPEQLETIFHPFVRGANQATGSGFGLGLAIAKRSVERHQGTLTAVNVQPCGLSMRIELPKTN